jgi:dephospho-CoA kinase
MLRIGLTGGLGSGKSTAAALFASLGAHILSADEIGRSLMQPGEVVFDAIVSRFGTLILLPNGRLDRQSLAKLAFGEGRLEELNAIVHPATIAQQSMLMDEITALDPRAIVIVESALLFETKYGGKEGWRKRFDKLILVTAPEDLRVTRFIARSSAGRTLTEAERAGLESEAHRRIAQQIPDEQKASLCDYVLTNSGAVTELEWQVDQLWPLLLRAAGASTTELATIRT